MPNPISFFMERKELKKSNGDVFFEAERRGNNAYILAKWTGIQSLETIMMGARILLAMLQTKSCPALLNSNRELIGPWDDGALFLSHNWVPQAARLGLERFAQVLAPGIYGRRSFQLFRQHAGSFLEVGEFETEAEANHWLTAVN